MAGHVLFLGKFAAGADTPGTRSMWDESVHRERPAQSKRDSQGDSEVPAGGDRSARRCRAQVNMQPAHKAET